MKSRTGLDFPFFTKEYLKFEQYHLNNLTNLWYETRNEELRLLILLTRKTLEDIFNGGELVSTRRDSEEGNSVGDDR